MDFTESANLIASVLKEVMPFLVILTITIFLVKIFLKSLKGKL